MALSVLRFNFASPHGNPSTQHELINAAIELAEWGDAACRTIDSPVVNLAASIAKATRPASSHDH
jgi:hypothetical protein